MVIIVKVRLFIGLLLISILGLGIGVVLRISSWRTILVTFE